MVLGCDQDGVFSGMHECVPHMAIDNFRIWKIPLTSTFVNQWYDWTLDSTNFPKTLASVTVVEADCLAQYTFDALSTTDSSIDPTLESATGSWEMFRQSGLTITESYVTDCVSNSNCKDYPTPSPNLANNDADIYSYAPYLDLHYDLDTTTTTYHFVDIPIRLDSGVTLTGVSGISVTGGTLYSQTSSPQYIRFAPTTPNSWDGPETITISLTLSDSGSHTSTLTVKIRDDNQIPSPPPDFTFQGAEDEQTAIVYDVEDPDGDFLQIQMVTKGSGTYKLKGAGSALTSFPYTIPKATDWVTFQAGTDEWNMVSYTTFTYKVIDDLETSSSAGTVTLTVAPENDMPTIPSDYSACSTSAEQTYSPTITDPDNEYPTIIVVTLPDSTKGTLQVKDANNGDTYTTLSCLGAHGAVQSKDLNTINSVSSEDSSLYTKSKLTDDQTTAIENAGTRDLTKCWFPSSQSSTTQQTDMYSPNAFSFQEYANFSISGNIVPYQFQVNFCQGREDAVVRIRSQHESGTQFSLGEFTTSANSENLEWKIKDDYYLCPPPFAVNDFVVDFDNTNERWIGIDTFKVTGFAAVETGVYSDDTTFKWTANTGSGDSTVTMKYIVTDCYGDSRRYSELRTVTWTYKDSGSCP
eukprot:NODE_24_length_2647_cov_561.262302_g23_i0.p1 GENE.NODE_24_length_2647_cov_561.262302_g23_i0~~NODE_24_length_2647_cov_561.262302_g23_i0.p1  ORF type:complete len:738 (+),score=152.77 NODE_24_length_2647_cov_561.262302_g23_i0:309-2216(+)